MTVSLWTFAPFLVAAVLLAAVRPRWAMLLPLVFHLSYRLRATVALGDFVVPTTLLEALVVLAIVTGVAVYRPRGIITALRSLPRSVLFFALLFLLAATLSAVIAPHPRTAWGQWKAFVVEPMLYALVLLPVLRESAGRRAVLSSLLLGGVVSAGASLVVGARTVDFGRLQGIYEVPNALALVLVPLVALAVPLSSAATERPLRLLARWSLVLTVPTLLLTQSLGGLIAAASGAVWTLVHGLGARRVRFLVLCSVLVVAVGFALQSRTGKLAHALGPDSPHRVRLQIWQISLGLIREHPLLGVGLGTFEPAYQQKLHELLRDSSFVIRLPAEALAKAGHSSFPREWVVLHPHNLLLAFWLNTGILGLAAMGGLVVVALRRMRKESQLSTFNPVKGPEGPNGSFTGFQLASAAALIAVLAFGVVDVPYFKNDLAILWWTLLAGLLAASSTSPSEAAPGAAVG